MTHMEKPRNADISELMEVYIKPKLNVSTEDWHRFVYPAIEDGIKKGLKDAQLQHADLSDEIAKKMMQELLEVLDDPCYRLS